MLQRLEVIDFLRGFSIFTIVLMHLLQSFPISPFLMAASSFGGAGVHVFILCSGFGLYLSYLNRPLTYIQFLKRRFLKVYLPYIIINLESSFGLQMWFVSTIIQFYLLWPLLLKLFNKSTGVIYALLISLLWTTIVAMLGKSDVRVWNSFFLQYLWEFVLGMYLAKCYKLNSEIVNLLNFKILVPVCILCVAFTGVAGLKGGIWKLYNDIPSMIGYLFTLLIIYKLHIKLINGLFVLTNKISYEWYLVHMLVFSCTFYYLYKLETFGMVAIAVISFIFSYVVACLYHWILSKMKIF